MKEKRAVLICFSVRSGRFESHYERNKFFRGLYGWKQMIRKEICAGKPGKKEKVYTYRREGLLDEMPHIKVDQSSFIVPEDEFEKITRFLKEWHDKVIWKTFKVLLDEDEFFEKEVEEM
ncbi:MAG: hypothetical protein QMD12_03425 [Candidatus Aenigmarchaeota archaeon]|nr:hypothetical protein [Candidatus Aenigmarchaeota archaeon]